MFGRDFDENNINNSEFFLVIERYESMMFEDQVGFFEEDEFERIIEYYERKNELEKAVRATDHAFIQYPFSAYFLVKKADLLFESKQVEAALGLLRQAEVLDSGELEIHLLKADIYSYRGQYNKAITVLRQAHKMADKEDLPEILISMADVYESWEKFEMVFHSLKKILLTDPSNEDALNRIWLAVDITEKYGESIELHKNIIDEDPYSYLAWYNLGQAYKGMGLYEKAAEALEYVTLINEDHDLAYRDLAEIWLRLNEPKKAIEVFEKVLELDDAYEEVYFGMGQAFEALGEHGRARYYYRKAVHMDPYYADAYFRTGENFRKEDRLSDALQAYKKALKLDGDNTEYLARFGDVSLALGHKEEAIANYKKVIQLEPKELQGYIRLVIVLMELEEMAEVEEVLQTAMNVCGEEASLLFLSGGLKLAQGKRQQAFVVIGEALAKDFRQYPILFEFYPPLIHDRDMVDMIDQFKEDH